MRALVIVFLAIPLVYSFFAATGCRKSSSGAPHIDTPYYTKMGGVRNWRGYYHDTYADPNVVNNYDVSGNYPDTSFAILFTDTNTISLFNKTFKYSSHDTAKNIYYFGNGYYFSMGYGFSEGVIYYYNEDSIVWGFHDIHNTWSYWYHHHVYHTY